MNNRKIGLTLGTSSTITKDAMPKIEQTLQLINLDDPNG